jgi:hypothetical protein
MIPNHLRKIVYVTASILSLIFVALAFQNFSLKTEPMGLTKDDHDEMYQALQGAVKESDEEKFEKRKAVVNGDDDLRKGRSINSIQHDPGEVYEGGPVSADMSEESITK